MAVWQRSIWQKSAFGKKYLLMVNGLVLGGILGGGAGMISPVGATIFPGEESTFTARSHLAQVLHPYPETVPSAATESEEPASAAVLPATKPATVFVEGDPTEITLHLFTGPDMPFYTYYPAVMTAAGTCYEEGCSAIFTGFEDQTRVAFFFPEATTDLAEMEAMVVGPTGLVHENGWQIMGEYSEPEHMPYPWVKKMLTFQASTDFPDLTIGSIYLGEANGRLFVATMVFPAEFGDGFAPLANVIFENLQVQSIESLNEEGDPE